MEPGLAALYGGAGALIPDVLKFINGRFGDAPAWVSKLHYWIAAVALLIIGAVVAYYGKPARVIDALALGYSAPAIVASLVGRGDGGPKEIDTTTPPGITKYHAGIPFPELRIPVPQLVRGIRSAWALR